MKMPENIPTAFLAPCGIDCAACAVRLRPKKACPGCLVAGESRPNHCRTCSIKACAAERGFKRCYGCADFPCAGIKRIDRRYLTRYGVGLVENGLAARRVGLRAFMAAERERWACPACPACGGIVSQHTGTCSECGGKYPPAKEAGGGHG
jgi:hypothetical protein